jgi:hypothetical protein
MLISNNFSSLYIMTIKGRRRKRTKKHKRRKTRHHKRRKRRKTRHRRGGGLPGISPAGGSPAAPFSGAWGGKMAAFPPGPMYKPGVNNDAKYYGKLDGVIAPPKNTHGNGFSPNHGKIKGGRKSRKGGRKSRKGGRRRKHGGSMSSLLANNVPGFSDVRDVYWKGGEVLKDGYNTWFGYDKADNTSAGVQPIGRNKDVVRPDIVDIPQKLKTGALSAKKYNAA